MLLDSKSRMIDSVFTEGGRYFLMRGNQPDSFDPKSLASPYFDLEGFSIAASSIDPVNLSTIQSVPNGIVTNDGPILGTRKTWARVTSVENLTTGNVETLADFSGSWKCITDYDNFNVGYFDLIRSVVSGTYDSGNSNWNLGNLSDVQGSSVSINGDGRELKYKWRTFNEFSVKEAEEIKRPDILAQSEFSQYVNGLNLSPVVQGDSGNDLPIKKYSSSNFQTNRLSSRTIRNRLIENSNEFIEVETTPMNIPVGVDFETSWIPVERRKFNIRFSNMKYTIQTAQALDVVKYDKNMFFVGKIVPTQMIGNENVVTNTFLRIFTIIFEDGT